MSIMKSFYFESKMIFDANNGVPLLGHFFLSIIYRSTNVAAHIKDTSPHPTCIKLFLHYFI